MSDVLTRLREATRADHEAIEKVVDVMRPDLTRRHYVRLLEAFYGFLAAWEPAARAGAPRLAGMLGERRKAHLLERDLRHFGYDDAALAAIPRCANLPKLSDVNDVLGSMYVLEGSTLGGQLIARHVEAVLGLEPGHGNAYFRGYGERTGAMWQSFRGVLAATDPASAISPICESGCETFRRLHNWLLACTGPHQGTGSMTA